MKVKVRCPRCRGVTLIRVKCVKCSGKGCPECGGIGFSVEICDMCKGKGWLEFEAPEWFGEVLGGFGCAEVSSVMLGG